MSNTTQPKQSPSYIYGKATTIKTDKFGNDNLLVVVKRNHNYPARVWEHDGVSFTSIKARHLKGMQKEDYEGKWFRFMVTGMGTYMDKEYVSSYQIDALPKHISDKLEDEVVAKPRMSVPFNELSDSEEEEEHQEVEFDEVEPEPVKTKKTRKTKKST